ncbi:FMN-binding protein [Desulfococcus sp.]|uniref:FMN-binding protein n=1 Tax=Desulfococcus sp. TaxID=2025834 RepID=UPI003592FAD0
MKPIEPMEPMRPGAFARLKNSNILQAWLVLFLSLCFGSSLAGVQMNLGPKIETNKLNETREKVPELVMGKEAALKMAEAGETLEALPESIVVQKPGKQSTYNVFEARKGADRLGWVVKAAGAGYADKIELLLGLDPKAEKITGIFVLEQKETPGLGNKIVTDEWRGQFTGKGTGQQMTVVKGGNTGAPNEINAVTGATISSRSVTDIINTAVADLKGPLSAKGSGGN